MESPARIVGLDVDAVYVNQGTDWAFLHVLTSSKVCHNNHPR